MYIETNDKKKQNTIFQSLVHFIIHVVCKERERKKKPWPNYSIILMYNERNIQRWQLFNLYRKKIFAFIDTNCTHIRHKFEFNCYCCWYIVEMRPHSLCTCIWCGTTYRQCHETIKTKFIFKLRIGNDFLIVIFELRKFSCLNKNKTKIIIIMGYVFTIKKKAHNTPPNYRYKFYNCVFIS